VSALVDQFTTTAFRLETLPAYDVPEERRQLDDFVAGLPAPERSVRTSRWLARMATTTVAGKAWSRLRVISDRPTPYERWELDRFVESQACGEQVRIIAREDHLDLVGRDFWLFDAGQPHRLDTRWWRSMVAGHRSAGTSMRRVRVVTALPPGQQAAATLYYLDGLTCGEVAEHLGTSVGAVKARLHKARAMLRRQLAPGWKEPTKMPTTDQLPLSMRISNVRATEQAAERRHVVVLTTDDASQSLLIWIGSAEALALARTLEGVQLPRPSVYHLTTALLQAAGRRLAEARITALTDRVIYAQTVLDDGAVVDARPSDALNLALLADAPIHVDPAVLQADQRADDHEDPTDYPMDARAILNAAT